MTIIGISDILFNRYKNKKRKLNWMQKKLVISCVCAISLTSIGVAGVYGKAEYDRLNNKIELKTKAVKELNKQKEEAQKENGKILEQKNEAEKKSNDLNQEKESLKKQLEEQKQKTIETEGQLQQALANKQASEVATQEYAQPSQPSTSYVVAVNYTGDSSSAKEWIAQKESGGSYSATNYRYIGRYQLDSSYLGGDHSPENQERVADAYVAGRYGSWEAAKQFWLANGWY